MHTYIHTHINTYIHTHIHTYILAALCLWMPIACKNQVAKRHARTRTRTRTHIHAHTRINNRMQTNATKANPKQAKNSSERTQAYVCIYVYVDEWNDMEWNESMKWMNEWNDCMNEWMNKWMNGWIDRWMKEGMTKSMHAWITRMRENKKWNERKQNEWANKMN